MEYLRWRKSSFSAGNPEQCVEACVTAESAFLRDSKNPAHEVLAVTPRQFESLLDFVHGRS